MAGKGRKSADMAALGKLGGKKGGPSRASKLTSTEKKDIARKGGLAKSSKSAKMPAMKKSKKAC